MPLALVVLAALPWRDVILVIMQHFTWSDGASSTTWHTFARDLMYPYLKLFGSLVCNIDASVLQFYVAV